VDTVELAVPPEANPTFHGRDVFAPAAAKLAAGLPFRELREKAFSLAFMIVFILLLRTLFVQAVNIILMPKLGTRIWCKYFCPQGLLIGLISRIGRFALVKDESLCTGCGICNQHCSMSIDITGGPAVIRSGECVGCGVCVEVCPRKALSMTTGAVSGVEKSDKVGV